MSKSSNLRVGIKPKNARQDAIATGATTYAGAPCKRGHKGDRFVKNYGCVECAREWTKAHPADKEKEHARQAAYRETRREDIRARAAAWAKAHPEKVREHQAAWRGSAAGIASRKTLREQERARLAAWNKAHPGAHRARQANRRALKRQQRCTCCTNADFRHLHDITSLCGPGAHVDHVQQLALGGPHCTKNLRVMTAGEHIEKTKLDATERARVRRINKTPPQFASNGGRSEV